MIFQYDGSPQGLLTAVFDGYPYRKNIRFESGFKASFFPDVKAIQTNEGKSQRVAAYLKDHFPHFFVHEFKWALLADQDQVRNMLGQTIFLMMDYGGQVLYSDREEPRAIVKNAKTVSSEAHNYKGLLRFKELANKALYGPIRPKANVLYPLGIHFKGRLPNEVFLIHDLGRGTGILYQDKKLSFVEIDQVEGDLSQEEEVYQGLWKNFTQAITIEERKNKKLQRTNMPKRYWEFLVEMQDL